MIEIKRDKHSKIYWIAAYLEKHAGSSASEIAKGAGCKHLIVHEVGYICSRNPELFVMTKKSRDRNVYSLNTGVVFV